MAALEAKGRGDYPGQREDRKNRVAGLDPLMGITAGIATGALLGVTRAAGWQPRLPVSALAATLGALIAGNAPMTVLGITDPRTWATADWIADIVPHVAFGAVTAGVLAAQYSPRTVSGR